MQNSILSLVETIKEQTNELKQIMQPTMKSESFSDYLERKHMQEEPMILDDDLPEAFDSWLMELDQNIMMEYAEQWHKAELAKFNF